MNKKFFTFLLGLMEELSLIEKSADNMRVVRFIEVYFTVRKGD